MLYNNLKGDVLKFLLLFLIVFGPVLDVTAGPFADLSFFISLSAVLFYFNKSIPLFIFHLGLVLTSIMLIAISTAIFFDTAVITVSSRAIIRPIKALVYLVSTYFILKSWFEEGVEHTKIIELIFLAISLHALIMFFQFILPEFRNFIYQFTMAKYQLEHYQNFRMAGLSGGGGAQLSYTQSFGFLIGLYLIKKRRFSPLFLWGCNLIILISIFLSGRSGFVFVLFSLIAFSIYSLIYKDFTLKSKLYLLGLLFGLFLVAFNSNIMDFEFFKIAFERNFDTLIRYQSTGDVRDNTFNALAEMIILPEKVLHLFFGVASYLENNTYYDINTDIGYFRLIWGYGISGLLLHIAFYAVLFLKSLRQSKGAEFQLLFCLFAFVFIFNAKEISFFSKMSFQIFLFLNFAIYFMKDNNFEYIKRS